MTEIEAIDRRLDETANARSQLDFYAGAYEMVRLLTTSPRFNRPQREILEDQGEICKERLEARGVSFTDTDNSHD